MNKKKILLGIVFCILSIAIVAALAWDVKVYLREQDPRWKISKEIYRLQTTLQQVDESTKLESISEARPFVITGPNDVSINYYCCITSYLNEEPIEIEGLNKTALDLIVDIDDFEKRSDCKVGSWAGVQGELGGLTYLCWTVSPKYSCVLEYIEGTIAEEDIFHMATSVGYVEK